MINREFDKFKLNDVGCARYFITIRFAGAALYRPDTFAIRISVARKKRTGLARVGVPGSARES